MQNTKNIEKLALATLKPDGCKGTILNLFFNSKDILK